MQFTNEIRRLTTGLLGILAIIGLTAAYWAVIGPERILPRDDNPRLFEANAAIQRGSIYDRNNTLLVESVKQPDGYVERRYLHPATYSILGYFSLRYGTAGIEAAYDELLRGATLEEDLTTYIERDMLHLPQQGVDIQLTLDADTQAQIIDAMQGHQGAVALLTVPDGAVLSVVSLPTYDPNILDSTWETLRGDATNPFFNRALQAQYQPGGLMYTILATAALIENVSLDKVYPNSTRPVEIGGTTLTCTTPPPAESLTLTQAYLYGCPAPFQDFIVTIGLSQIERRINLFRLDNPIQINNVTLPPATPTPSSPRDITLPDAVGQGMLTANPLHMAAIAASIINGGNAPEPYILAATRPPDTDNWQPDSTTREQLSITTVENSRSLQSLMRSSVTDGSAHAAAVNGLDIGGQVALAYSGEGTVAWFIGFVRLDQRQGLAVAIVLEDSEDLDLAARIGGVALASGVEAIRTPD